jgi:RNA polymerase sigma factor (sigma-70 family)
VGFATFHWTSFGTCVTESNLSLPTVASTPATESTPASAHQARWFSDEVHAHDSSLRSYLRGSFPAVRDVDDVVQESYRRVWQAAAKQKIRSAKAFLFTVARRLALDHVRHTRVSPIESVGHLAGLAVVEDGRDLVEDVGRRERLELLAEAISQLPDRCREVFLLYKIQGLPRREAAARLGLSEKTVEVHTARAMRHCERFFQRKGVKGVFDHDSR